MLKKRFFKGVTFVPIFPFIKPICAHLTHTAIQTLVYSYMFRRNSAIFRESIYQYLKFIRVYYITIITYIVS
jgi:hypothetical protein